jgi:hypothetical protein
VGEQIVHAAGDFEKLAPPALPVSPDWSPVKEYGGYHFASAAAQRSSSLSRCAEGLPYSPLRLLACDCFGV